MRVLEAHYELLLPLEQSPEPDAHRQLEEAVERHYGSRSSWQPPAAWPLRMADVGSGAGFPGFPWQWCGRTAQLTLIESHQRKAVFLREASRGVSNIRVIARRAEEVQEHFDWVISRAVSYDDLAKCLPALAGNAALLTGAEAPPGFAGGRASGTAPVSLPWGETISSFRVSRETECWLFHVKQ